MRVVMCVWRMHRCDKCVICNTLDWYAIGLSHSANLLDDVILGS